MASWLGGHQPLRGLLTAAHTVTHPSGLFCYLSARSFTRDVLLVYFFTTIGINARFSDLLSGGRRLLLLLGLTWATSFFKTWSAYLVPG